MDLLGDIVTQAEAFASEEGESMIRMSAKITTRAKQRCVCHVSDA
jgi:hypothetical protein